MNPIAIFVVSLAVLASAEDGCDMCTKSVGTFLSAMSSPEGLDIQLDYIKNEACSLISDKAQVETCAELVVEFYPQIVQALANDPEIPGIFCNNLDACGNNNDSTE